jgi:N-methylhydantoinase B
VKVAKGDRLDFITWGGGGWGDPLERDPELVALEVRRALVSAEGARNYGVVVDPEGRLDPAATATLRAEMRAQHNELPVFNRGPGIETLRERCLAETGLPAPLQPVWRTAPQSLAAE